MESPPGSANSRSGNWSPGISMGICRFSWVLGIDYFDSLQRAIDARIESGTPILGVGSRPESGLHYSNTLISPYWGMFSVVVSVTEI